MGPIILVIEDNEDIRESIEETLLLSGYRVMLAENGKAGLALLKTAVPNLILCDIMMPEVGGYEILKILNEWKGFGKIPFIFMTAKSSSSERQKAIELGVDNYLIKPFDDTLLLAAVKDSLSRYN